VEGGKPDPKTNCTPESNPISPISSTKRGHASLQIECLEPRILLSATWTGTDGADVHHAEANQADEAYGLGGDDALYGNIQHDQLYGGDGNDQLFGDQGKDTLDGGAGDDVLDGGAGNDVLISGGGHDVMLGKQGSDIFQFTGAQDGDVVTVDGGQGTDTIDLSSYRNDQIDDNGSTIVVDMSDSESFTIHYTNIEKILTANGEYVPGHVNDAPIAQAGSLSIQEDSPAVVSLSAVDPDSDDPVAQFRIDSLPEHGQLLLNGEAVLAGDTVTHDQIENGELVYAPDSDWHGQTSFQFSAYDGRDWSAPAGFDLDVTPANDAPVVAGGSLSLNEDSPAAVHLSASDPDSGDAVEQFRIDSLPEHGRLLLNGQPVQAGTVVTQTQIDGGGLTYAPDHNWHGQTGFQYSAHDGDDWSAPAEFSIQVRPVDDTPTADAGLDQVVEAGSQVILNASESGDVESDTLSYTWTQVDGPSVQLSDSTAAQPTFVAPSASEPSVLVFQVAVNDGQSTRFDTVEVQVNASPAESSVDQEMEPPVVGDVDGGAESGPDQQAGAGNGPGWNGDPLPSTDSGSVPDAVSGSGSSGTVDQAAGGAVGGSWTSPPGSAYLGLPPNGASGPVFGGMGIGGPHGEAGHSGDSGVSWNGYEDIGVLDPNEGLHNVSELTGGLDNSQSALGDPAAGGDSVGEPATGENPAGETGPRAGDPLFTSIPSAYEFDRVVTLPDFRAASAPSVVLPAGALGLTAEQVFERVIGDRVEVASSGTGSAALVTPVVDVRAAASQGAARFSPIAGPAVGDMDEIRRKKGTGEDGDDGHDLSDGVNGNTAEDDSGSRMQMASAAGSAPVGLLAGLWSAIRGLGATFRGSEQREGESRGNRR
jgi:hypothetical protein